MKTIEEILCRSIGLIYVGLRCVWERRDSMFETPEDQAKDWEEVNEWFSSNGYGAYLTEEERELVNIPALQAGLEKAGPFSFLEECVPLLFWSIGLLEEPPHYYAETCAYDCVCKIGFMKDRHDRNALLAQCKMRSKEEIEKQCNIAFLWHWRAVESRLNPKWRGNIRQVIHDTFGGAYDHCLDAFQMYDGKNNSDLLFNARVIYELDRRSRNAFEMCAEMRHRALEWILCDEDWDETPTDT